MSVRVSGALETKALFDEVERFLRSETPMKGIVEDVKETIEDRTSKGKDYMSRKFEPYSPAYAKRKGKTKVDLRDTGLMLGSLDTEVINAKHGRVFIKPQSYGGKKKAKTDMVAQIHTTGTGKQPQREFMNISRSMLSKIIKKNYDDMIMKILGRR